jgi:hypothetical protein
MMKRKLTQLCCKEKRCRYEPRLPGVIAAADVYNN